MNVSVSICRASKYIACTSSRPAPYTTRPTFDQIDAIVSDLPTALYITAVEIEGTTVFGQIEGSGTDQFGMLFEKDNPLVECVDLALTALEASLRATLTFDVVPAADARREFGDLTGPLVRTPEYLVPTGLDPDLNAAMRKCVRAAVDLLQARWGMDEHLAYAYLSAATDFDISQVVDVVCGVHARIREADFADVARSVAVTAYQSASGLVNLLTPTSAVIMGGLALSKVGYDRYLKFVWPFVALAFVVSCLFVGGAAVLS